MKLPPAKKKDEMSCRECGKTFTGSWNKHRKYVPAAKKLAGHIINSKDHYNKRWAKMYFAKNVQNTGLRFTYPDGCSDPNTYNGYIEKYKQNKGGN